MFYRVSVLAALSMLFYASNGNASLLFSDSFQDASGLLPFNDPYSSALITTAPDGSQALTFTKTESVAGGNIQSKQNFASTTGSYTVSFDVLARCNFTTQCGFFLGASGATPNYQQWIIADSVYGSTATFNDVQNTWETISYTFAGTSTNLFLEDWTASAHSFAESFFVRNLVLTDNPTGVATNTFSVAASIPIPEPASAALLASVLVSLRLTRRGRRL